MPVINVKIDKKLNVNLELFFQAIDQAQFSLEVGNGCARMLATLGLYCDIGVGWLFVNTC